MPHWLGIGLVQDSLYFELVYVCVCMYGVKLVSEEGQLDHLSLELQC